MRHLNSEIKAEKAKFSLILFVFNVTIGCSKKDSLQLSPEGEVNSGAYTKTRSVELYIEHFSPILRGIVVLVFTKSVG